MLNMQNNNSERGGTSALVERASAWSEFGLGVTNEARFLFGTYYCIPHEVEVCRAVGEAYRSSRAFRAGATAVYATGAIFVPIYLGFR